MPLDRQRVDVICRKRKQEMNWIIMITVIKKKNFSYSLEVYFTTNQNVRNEA